MKFNLWSKILYVFASILIIAWITGYSIFKEIKVTETYLSKIFGNLSTQLSIVAEDNIQKAEIVYQVLDQPDLIRLDEKSLNSFSINEYPERNEYGFNQGVYPDVVASGSLYGVGPVPDKLKNNVRDFLTLDQIWGGYQRSLLPSLSALVNYRYNYIYLSVITKLKDGEHQLFDQAISSQVYRQGLGLNYTSSLEDYGYFISPPFKTFHSNTWRIAILVPIYKNGQLVADIGESIEITNIIDLLGIYPELNEAITITFNYAMTGQGIQINNPDYQSLIVHTYTYDMPGYVQFQAHYDIMHFVFNNFELVAILIVIFTIIFFHLSSIDTRRQARYELSKQLDIDPMTQLYNRHAMDNMISKKVQIEKTKNSISYVAIDANRFKQLNDTYGHIVGDKAIKHIAKIMQEFIRKGDYCVRMGGDEFMIVFFGVAYDDAKLISQRLEDKIKTTSKEAIGVEFSVTCASIELDRNEGFDEAYKRVDDALYERKRA